MIILFVENVGSNIHHLQLNTRVWSGKRGRGYFESPWRHLWSGYWRPTTTFTLLLHIFYCMCTQLSQLMNQLWRMHWIIVSNWIQLQFRRHGYAGQKWWQLLDDKCLYKNHIRWSINDIVRTQPEQIKCILFRHLGLKYWCWQCILM